ncbi:MAG: leucine-rich repeat protein [Clostridia bacterium]|nr:leucine-rich repeat protein [Clostridia bacterium]
MYEKDKIKLDAISGIDEEIIDKTTEIRWSWLQNLGKRVKKSYLWVRIVAVAACFCLAFGGGMFAFLKFFRNDPNAPISEKQVPIYTGMSVHNSLPTVETSASVMSLTRLSGDAMDFSRSSLTFLHGAPDQSDPYERGEHGPKMEDAVEEEFKLKLESARDDYFAKKNEDVYFVIHIDNPDNFEILSFTINGTKYSSYMFEEGSDMETLILKYNVGDVDGTQEYTIDAIKYIDGEQIKDVSMDGEQTVRVHIYPEDQPTVAVTSESIGFFDISFVTELSDPNALISASEGELYAVLYDGEDIVAKKEIQHGDTVLFDGLVPETLYQYAIVAVYDAVDGEGAKAHILTKKAVYTENVFSLTASRLSGVDVSFKTVWHKDYTGEKTLSSLGLYEGDTLLREISTTDRKVEDLPFDKELTLRATYMAGEHLMTVSIPIESPQSSQGLAMTGGVVTGIGSCQDAVLYINAPVGKGVFENNEYLTTVYFGEKATSIGERAFAGCTSLNKIDFGNGVRQIGKEAFSGAESLTEITVPDSVTSIGESAFEFCLKLHTVTIQRGVSSLGASAFSFCLKLGNVSLPDTLRTVGDFAFYQCEALKKIEIPEGVSHIGEYCFKNSDLSEVTVPSSVTEAKYAFADCKRLTKVTISEGVTMLSAGMFYNCPRLNEVHFPSTLIEIGNLCFAHRGHQVKTVSCLILPRGLQKIGAQAFYDAKGSVVIPSTVSTVGQEAFWNSVALCEASEKPFGWHEDWCNGGSVTWGYTAT